MLLNSRPTTKRSINLATRTSALALVRLRGAGHGRQPDFIVLSPRQGVLLLEVKDWKRSTLLSATRDRVELRTARGDITEANPLRQARDYALELVDVMK